MKPANSTPIDKKLERYALVQKQTHCECILPPPCSFFTDTNEYELKYVPPRV